MGASEPIGGPSMSPIGIGHDPIRVVELDSMLMSCKIEGFLTFVIYYQPMFLIF